MKVKSLEIVLNVNRSEFSVIFDKKHYIFTSSYHSDCEVFIKGFKEGLTLAKEKNVRSIGL